MEIKKLNEAEIKVNLERLRDWKLENGKLHKLFKFKTFRDAFQFMTGVAIESEKLNHHPEWSNVYGNVDVKLITHKVAGITELDFKLAEKMDEIFTYGQ
jgi:4a-hydroxytetrahydrobiopterin dehydratase